MTTTLTPSDIMGLSDEALEEAIAPLDGWVHNPRVAACWSKPGFGHRFCPPDYATKLDAIAPVEQKVLEKVGELVYHDALVQMRLRTLGKSLADATCAELATVAWADARKRCIACLLALKEEG